MDLTKIMAAATGFLAVGFGAFGAHALEESLSAGDAALWDKATLYALVHAVAAYAAPSRVAAAAFLVGVWLFSGALYALALGGPPALGMAAPVGGLSFLAGWGLVAADAARRP